MLKVAESMSNLRDVIEEREEAKNMLVHGTPDGIGGSRVRDFLWHTSSVGNGVAQQPPDGSNVIFYFQVNGGRIHLVRRISINTKNI